MLTIVNASSHVSESEARLITRACAHQLRHDIGPDYGKTPEPVIFSDTARNAAPGSSVLILSDTIDDPNALGYHTEVPGDVESAIIGVDVILSQPGASVLEGDMSVAAVTSHEVCEWFVDPHCNLIADTFNGFAIAYEVCDPVESDYYVIRTWDPGTRQYVPVSVSNYVTPSWFDPQAAAGAHDKLGNTTAPFTMTPGGYVVKIAEGQATAVFGENYPEWRKALKNRATGRGRRFVEGVRR